MKFKQQQASVGKKKYFWTKIHVHRSFLTQNVIDNLGDKIQLNSNGQWIFLWASAKENNLQPNNSSYYDEYFNKQKKKMSNYLSRELLSTFVISKILSLEWYEKFVVSQILHKIDKYR